MRQPDGVAARRTHGTSFSPSRPRSSAAGRPGKTTANFSLLLPATQRRSQHTVKAKITLDSPALIPCCLARKGISGNINLDLGIHQDRFLSKWGISPESTRVFYYVPPLSTVHIFDPLQVSPYNIFYLHLSTLPLKMGRKHRRAPSCHKKERTNAQATLS